MTYRADQKSGEGDDPYEYRLHAGISWGSLTRTVKLSTRLKGEWRMENSAYYSGMMNRYKTDSRDNASGSLHAFTRSAVGIGGARSVFVFATPATEIKTGLQLSLQRYIPKDVYSKSVGSDGRTMEKAANNGTRLLYNAALFADGNSRVGRWSFHYGLRLPLYYNKKDLLLSAEPRAGVSFEINGRNDFFLSYDRSTQPLFSLTKQFMGVPMDLWMPYQSRELQSADQISAGWKYRPTEAIFVSVEAYWKKMNNLYFVSDEDAMLAGKGGYDIGTGRAVGAELVFQYTGRTNMVLLSSYTHSSSKRYVAGRKFDFEYDIPYNLNIYFRQRTLKRGDREHYFSVNLNYHAGLPYIALQGDLSGRRGRERLAGVHSQQSPLSERPPSGLLPLGPQLLHGAQAAQRQARVTVIHTERHQPLQPAEGIYRQGALCWPFAYSHPAFVLI